MTLLKCVKEERSLWTEAWALLIWCERPDKHMMLGEYELFLKDGQCLQVGAILRLQTRSAATALKSQVKSMYLLTYVINLYTGSQRMTNSLVILD